MKLSGFVTNKQFIAKQNKKLFVILIGLMEPKCHEEDLLLKTKKSLVSGVNKFATKQQKVDYCHPTRAVKKTILYVLSE